MNPYNEVLFEEKPGKEGNLGIITLNRPGVLNSLNHDMITAMYSQLQFWAKESHIKAIVIRASEARAFCAGGDLRLTYERAKAKDPAMYDFFRDEYQLNRFIFHYPKPYIALLSGITMGGGVGISIHGSHRVASENLIFAMPETGIGFYPDVGGTYFLPRLADHYGYYLGLTGARIGSDDGMALGIVQHKVAYEQMPALIDALAATPFKGNAKDAVSAIINPFQLSTQPSLLKQHVAEITNCFSKGTMIEILTALNKASGPICQEAEALLAKKSPTSLAVTLKALQKGQQMDFDACMHQEFYLTSHFLQHHDFLEGIRALIIDKDQQPLWEPMSISDVDRAEVDSYFAKDESVSDLIY